MKIYFILFFYFLAFNSHAQKRYEYPIAPKDSTTDNYFGTLVKDPYQWMENQEDPKLQEWIEAQKKLTRKVSNNQTRKLELRAQISSMYNDIERETTDSYVNPKDEFKSKYVFEWKETGYKRAPDLLYKLRGSMKKTLVSRKDFENGKDDQITINVKSVNEDHDIVAIEISHYGGDWREIFLFDLKTGDQLPDTLKNVRIGGSLIWKEKDIFYDRYNAPAKGRELLDRAKEQKFCYHKFGSSQKDDLILYQNQDTTGTKSFDSFEVNDRLFLDLPISVRGQNIRSLVMANMDVESFYFKNILAYPDVDTISMEVSELIGDTILFKSNWNAPNGKVLMLDINRPNQLSELVPELDVPLWDVSKLGKGKIVCTYRYNGNNTALIYSMKGELLKQISFPQGKKVNGLYENEDKAERTVFSVSSFYHPPLHYQISLDDLEFKPVQSLSVPYDPDLIETRYVTYQSKDGTEIPMYITCRKDIKLDGSNATLMYGYGGYGITVEPRFNPSQALLLLHGGVLAMPNIRGGGSEGLAWGLEGRRLKKQNAIDDFIAAGEYLINSGYTRSEKLAASGGSHGAMLVAAAVTQRPQLFEVAIMEAGPYDMLRFEQFTAGGADINHREFGKTINEEEFYVMHSYSPLHNIVEGTRYPSMLLISGDHDDRVPPLHSYKFLATLQEKVDSKSTIVMYLTPGSGHGGALTNQDFEDKLLFEYYFLFNRLGVDFY
jgi:prolyl oligopeptidase